MPFLRLPRPTLRRMCACTLLTTILAVVTALVFAIFYIALPMRRAHYLELDYQRKLLSSDHTEDQDHNYVRPLVEDVKQVFFWTIPDSKFKTWNNALRLNNDGTSKGNGLEYEVWIYLAGTAPDSQQQPNTYTHKWKKPDCQDPAYICDMYLDAFRNISKRWHDPRRYSTRSVDRPQSILRYVDCDVSPMLCSPAWGLSGANVLVHMEVGLDCSWGLLPGGSCPVTWRWFGLPVYQAPWTRKIRIPLVHGGSTVVPAFPSAEEQMWTIMTSDGMIEGMDYDNEGSHPPSWNSMVNVARQDEGLPKTNVWPYPFFLWGWFRDVVENPWDAPEWPYETEIKCYIERYADLLLGWWDDAAHLVQPRSCVGIAEEKRRKKRKMMEEQVDWDEYMARENAKFRTEWDGLMDEIFTTLKIQMTRNETSDVKDER